MLRTEMIDNLLDSFTKRELKVLAEKLGISASHIAWYPLDVLSDRISDILFDPAGSYHEFNKLAEADNEIL